MSQASSNIQNVIQCEERMPMSKASSNARLETPLFDGVDYDQVLLPNGILAMLVSDTSLQR
jgi:secreted Zn-dependent insulinase-like peptidase